MIGYFFSMLLLTALGCILQQFSPTLTSLYSAQVLILPLIFLCCAVTVSPAAMLPLAFACGFLWDAQHHVGPVGGILEVYPEPVAALRFGYSIFLYGAMGYFMLGIQPLFREGKWHVSALLAGVALFLYLLAEYLLINFVRGQFHIDRGVFLKITITSLISMLLAPLVFWALFRLAEMFRYTVRYDGLRKSKRSRDPLAAG